jgi:hypothetical protein
MNSNAHNIQFPSTFGSGPALFIIIAIQGAYQITSPILALATATAGYVLYSVTSLVIARRNRSLRGGVYSYEVLVSVLYTATSLAELGTHWPPWKTLGPVFGVGTVAYSFLWTLVKRAELSAMQCLFTLLPLFLLDMS